MVVHEMHALDREKLVVKRDGPFEWKPEAGLERKELAGAPAPADTAAARFVQLKRLAAEFTGHSIDREKKRWELKLLPTPLYRYPTAKTGVIDGALFALVSTAGTDPEVLLLVEAREEKGKTRWSSRAAASPTGSCTSTARTRKCSRPSPAARIRASTIHSTCTATSRRRS